jgi:sorting nexin-7/30
MADDPVSEAKSVNGSDISINHSVVDSPSMGSISSSVFNSLRFEDTEDQGGAADFLVRVDNPEKHVTAMETFVTFRITLRVRTGNLRRLSIVSKSLYLLQ